MIFMKQLFGDVTEQDKTNADGLSRMEAMLVNKKNLSKINRAKGYVYITYHWYALGMEEEGNRLLQQINDVCPDYFRKHLKKHMETDAKYNDLVINLFIEFAYLLTFKPQQYVTIYKKD